MSCVDDNSAKSFAGTTWLRYRRSLYGAVAASCLDLPHGVEARPAVVRGFITERYRTDSDPAGA
jgi:hypothetical protein